MTSEQAHAWNESLEAPISLVPNIGAKSVTSIMKQELAVVRSTLSVERLAGFLFDRGLTSAAVCNELDVLVGYVSMHEIVRARYSEQRAGDARPSTVADVMVPFVVRISATATIPEAAAVMAEESVHSLLIVSTTNVVIGVISAGDVMRWFAGRTKPGRSHSARARWCVLRDSSSR